MSFRNPVGFAESYVAHAAQMLAVPVAFATVHRIGKEQDQFRTGAPPDYAAAAGGVLGILNGLGVVVLGMYFANRDAPVEAAAGVLVGQGLSYLYERRRERRLEQRL